MMLTSDRVTKIEFGDCFDPGFLNIGLMRVSTEKGMTLLVDERRFNNLEVGDQINISLEVIKKW